jgi:antitoxin CptB
MAAEHLSAAEAGRLRWRCRRGMKELDVVLERCLAELLPGADAAERQAFGRLLTLPDPELAGYLLHGASPKDAALARWVGRIRGLCRLSDRAEYSLLSHTPGGHGEL